METQERTTKGHADQGHPDISNGDGVIHIAQHFVAVAVVVEVVEKQPSADTDPHPNHPGQKDHNVDSHALVVAQNVLDALEGIGAAGDVRGGRIVERVKVVVRVASNRVASNSFFGLLQSRRGTNGGGRHWRRCRRRIHSGWILDEIDNVYGRYHVGCGKGGVDHQPPKQGIGALEIGRALDGVYDRGCVQKEGHQDVWRKGGAEEFSDLVASPGAGVAGNGEGPAALGNEFAEGCTENGRHDVIGLG